MIAELLLCSAAAGLSVGRVETQATPERVVPASEGRMFALRSVAAWPLVQERLKQLGFKTEKVDRQNQVLLMKWRLLGEKGMAWLPSPALMEPYTAERVQFEVYVSPFAEPARVYVGSILEGREQMGSPATAYNVPNVNRSLMAELAKALGGEGPALPLDAAKQRELALSLLKEGVGGCPVTLSGGGATPPRKIPLSEFEVIYPAGAVKEGKEGQVRVEFTIRQDGSVTDLRLVESPPGYRFEASAMGAASLLLYEPATLAGCRVPAVMTYTMRFRRR